MRTGDGEMVRREKGRIIETATESRQAEPGRSIFAVLSGSLGLAIVLMGVVWFIFFRT